MAACGPEFVDSATQPTITPAGTEFWDRPMPSDLRVDGDGSYDLEKWPGSRESDLLKDWFSAANVRLRGWGVNSGVFVPMGGALDASSLPADPSASMAPESSVFLVDIDPASPEVGRRFPLQVRQLTEVDVYTPEHLLAATPVFGFVRRPATQYALVITTDVRDANGNALGRSRAFHDAIEGSGTEELEAHYEPLVDFLDQEGFDKARVAGAAVFKAMAHNDRLLALIDWVEGRPEPELRTGWTVEEDYESYQILRATYEVPVIQSGERPYFGINEGFIIYKNGEPEVQSTQEVRILVTVPKSPMPSDGYPLTIYMHGSGGEARQAIDRGPTAEIPPPRDAPVPGTGPAEWLARRGVATVGFDFPLHGERHNPPDTNGLLLYNLFGNLSATIDNFNVSAMELAILSRLMNAVTIDPALSANLDAGGASDGLIRFDPERLTAMGQSMGTTIGVNWAGVDPRLKGVVFSGAGGILVEIAVTAVEPVQLKGLAEILLKLEDDEEVHLQHPVLHAAQNIWDLVDPIAKSRYVVEAPHDGIQPKHVMMTAGFLDGYFNPRSEAAMAVAMGLPMVGEEVEPVLPDTLRLAGRDTLDYPLAQNVNGRTAAVVGYDAPFTLGHYVVFNQEGARHQFTCFLASVGTGNEQIAQAGALDDPCPN